MLDSSPHAAETDPRTPELRPRRPHPARPDRRARSRSGPRRPHPRRRLRLRAGALRERRGARRRRDDLRRPVPRGGHGGRGAAGHRPHPGAAPRRRRGGGRPSGARQLGPLRGSALQPGFPLALERLLDELQGAGLEPADVEAVAGTLEGSAYLGDIAALFAGYARVRDGLGTVDTHGIAREAIDLLRGRRRVLAATGLPLRPRRPDPQPAGPDPRRSPRSPT